MIKCLVRYFGKSEAEWVPSPNYSSRKGKSVDTVVLHHTAATNIHSTLYWFKDPDSDVSAHYVVDKNGDVYQMVDEKDAAWHCRGYNTRSIGIECVGKNEPLEPDQEQSLIRLVTELMFKYKLDRNDIKGHGYLPNKSTKCPGLLFGENGIMTFTRWKMDNLPDTGA